MKERNNTSFLKTHVYRDNGDIFFVSTIYRESSAQLNPDSWYFETFAWKMKDGKQDEWVADNSGAPYEKSAMKQHFNVVEQLTLTGVYTEEYGD